MGADFVPLLVTSAFLVAAILPGILRPFLKRAGMMDVPNERSSHRSTAIRGVGLAPAITLIVSLVILGGERDLPLLWLGACSVIFGSALVGAVEDIRGIPSKYRAILQIVIAGCGSSMVVLGTDASLWWLPFASIIIATYINVANFMDGINGISGGHGLFVGLNYIVLGVVSSLELLTQVGMLLAVVFLAFLPWNLIHGKMFLGDVGSYLLGSSIGIMSVSALIQGVHPVAILGPVAIYLADTGLTLWRRIRNGEKWSEAHRSHVYQRLTGGWRPHWKVSLLVSAFGLTTGCVGLLAVWDSQAGWWLGLPLIVLISSGYVALPSCSLLRSLATNVPGRVVR